MVKARESVDSIQTYVAGKQTASGGNGRQAIRLAANESPFGPLPSVRDAVLDALTTVNRYPNPSGAALRAAIAGQHGIEPDQVTIGPGAGALCERAVLATCGAGDELVYPDPSFPGYRAYAGVSGAAGRPVPLTPDGRHDLDAMAAALSPATRAVILCNPNNPTGAAIAEPEMREFVRRVPDDCLIIVDEAYVEFADPAECAQGRALIEERSNVVVLRTFSKAYGLAGLRAGYAIGAAAAISVITKAQTPFQINSLGQVAAIACLAAGDELAARRAEIVEGRERLRRSLIGLGYDAPPVHGNFVWLPMPGRESAELAAALEPHGVLTRPQPPHGLRVTVGTDEENEQVVAAFTATAAPSPGR